jgi:glycine/D-amino acid oxidase-like deaminating enzyme
MTGTLSDAEIVIIGGGAVGCGVAYSLARAGKKDIVLIERAADVAQVTTSQGAGLCGQPRSTLERTRLAMHSVATFRELQKDPKVQPEWHEVGSLRIALSDRRADEFKQLKAVADEAGLEAELIDNTEAQKLWPAMQFKGVKAVLWCPSDGYMKPYAVASSYAYQCRKMGVRFWVDTEVEEILCNNGAVEGVRTNRGRLACRYVINAAGANAYHIAKLVGLELPIVPVRHEYFVTVAMQGLTPDLPCFRVPELTLYGRPCEGGLLLGGWETRSLQTDPRDFSLKSEPDPVQADWAVLNSFEEQFSRLFPQAKGADKARVGKGWPTFTPDGRFIIGESSRVKGFVMAGGCNAHGISGSAGIGRLLVESMLEAKPSEYVRSLSPDRFTETKWNWDQARREAAQVYETYYGV